MSNEAEDNLFIKKGFDAKFKDGEDSPSAEPSGVKKFLADNIKLVLILVGVFLGVTVGFGLRPFHLSPDTLLLISYPGELFMRLLKLMILPLIIASLIACSASLNAKMSGKIAARTLIYFVMTSMFNAFFGIVLAMMIHPGQPQIREGNEMAVDVRKDHNALDSILDIGRNLVPDNIVESTFHQTHTVYKSSNTMRLNTSSNNTLPDLVRVLAYRSGTNTLGLVFFCLTFGSLLGTLGPRGKVVVDFFQAIFEVIMKIVTLAMWFTPVGVGSIIAGKILEVKDIAQTMTQLAWFIATVTFGVFFYQLIVMQLIYFFFLRRNPYKFYFGLLHAMLTAVSMGSTAAALPVTFRAIEGPLKVDPRITRFVLPIGANINTDGTALYLAVASVFICQMNSLPLGLAQLTTILITSTAASLSTASVPSGSLVLLLIVLASVDAPTHDMSLLFAVDWLVDRIRTTNNMLGDCYAAAVVDHLSKKELMACDALTPDPTSDLKRSTDVGDIPMYENKLLTTEEVSIDMPLENKNTH